MFLALALLFLGFIAVVFISIIEQIIIPILIVAFLALVVQGLYNYVKYGDWRGRMIIG